jgi:hypothetical protein
MSEQDLKFLVKPRMSLSRRFWIGAGLIAAGLAVQLALSWIAGAAFLLAAGIFLFAPGGSNKPPEPAGEGKWEEVTEVEYARVLDLSRCSRSWGVSFLDLNSGRGILTLLALGAGTVVFGLFLSGFGEASGPFPWGAAASNLTLSFLFDVALLALPLWLAGNDTRYSADELVLKIQALDNVARRLQDYPAEGWRLRRLLECRPCGKSAIPADARLHLVPQSGSKDFLGIQVQVSLNNVQGTKYPYLYCVVLAKEGFGLFQAEPPPAKKEVFEQENSEGVDVVVVRQETTKTSGYHTKAADQVRVFEMALAYAQNALGASV